VDSPYFHWEKLIEALGKKHGVHSFRHSASLANSPSVPYLYFDMSDNLSNSFLYSRISSIVNNFKGNTNWLMKIAPPSTWVIIPQPIEFIIEKLILEAEQGVYFSFLCELLEKNGF
jgi:hypothetical protein